MIFIIRNCRNLNDSKSCTKFLQRNFSKNISKTGHRIISKATLSSWATSVSTYKDNFQYNKSVVFMPNYDYNHKKY